MSNKSKNDQTVIKALREHSERVTDALKTLDKLYHYAHDSGEKDITLDVLSGVHILYDCDEHGDFTLWNAWKAVYEKILQQ